jgi:hypothetical protein
MVSSLFRVDLPMASVKELRICRSGIFLIVETPLFLRAHRFFEYEQFERGICPTTTQAASIVVFNDRRLFGIEQVLNILLDRWVSLMDGNVHLAIVNRHKANTEPIAG